MGEIVPIAVKANQMRKFFEERKGEIGTALARVGVNPDRIIRAVFTSAQKNPDLYNCTLESTYKAVLLSAQAGLVPDGVTQQAHLIPRKNSKKGNALECNLQIGYRGYLTLCRRSGDVEDITPVLVRDGDTLDLVDGMVHHVAWKNAKGYPSVTDNEGKVREIVGAWAKAKWKSGSESHEWMDISEIERLRVRANANGPAWDTDYGEMCKKTVMRRLCKRLPQSEDAARLLELDAQAEGGHPQNIADIRVPGVDEAKPVEATVTDAPPTMDEFDAEESRRLDAEAAERDRR